MLGHDIFVILTTYLVFYALVIRPDREENRSRLSAVLALSVGDWVLAHGILGRVTETGSMTKMFAVEVGRGTVIHVRQEGITHVIGREPPREVVVDAEVAPAAQRQLAIAQTA